MGVESRFELMLWTQATQHSLEPLKRTKKKREKGEAE